MSEYTKAQLAAMRRRWARRRAALLAKPAPQITPDDLHRLSIERSRVKVGSAPPDYKTTLHKALADADQSFADTGDIMEALGWIALAGKAGAPVPPRMGRWLHQALQTYINGAGSMDEAMGLGNRGAGQARRKSREASELNDTLGRMWFLIRAGADRTQAAVLVAARSGRSVEQLQRSYGASWFARRTDNPFEGMPTDAVRGYIIDMLAEYPDTAETSQEKAAILKRYPAPPAF